MLILVLALLLIAGCKTAIDVIVGPPEEQAPQPPAAPEPAAPETQPTPQPAAPSVPVQPVQPPAPNATLNASNASVQEAAVQPVPGVHTILIKNDGFEPKLLKIKAGGMVIWKNTRTTAVSPQASLIIGARLCRDMRSPKLEPEESFNHTFPAPLTCEYADGIYTRQGGVIVVE